jgi:serine/threonine-protein kinase
MTKIGPYEILDTLHSGPRPLYKVRASDGRLLALKSISAEGLSEEMRERFQREGEICRTLDHPNLVRVHDAGEADGVLYQAMDLLEGGDLSKAFAAGRQFTWPEKLSIMEKVCAGLQFAHEHRILHRDIKPANIFLEDSGGVRVLDFGMARVAASELTKVGSTLGTVNYMSPEQIRGERCTAASDVFSACIVFYQLASGRHPFSSRERSLPQVVSAIVFEAPPKLGEICAGAPEGLEFLLNKGLEKAPDSRFPTAGELKQAIMLCHITLDMAGGAALPAPLPEEDNEATRVLAKADLPASPPDEAKTRAIKRSDFVPKTVGPPVPSAAPPATPPKPAPQPAEAPRYRYCPSCTFANAPSAPFCGGCGIPLGAAPAAPAPARKNWSLYIAVGIAVLLAIALAVVLIVKR